MANKIAKTILILAAAAILLNLPFAMPAMASKYSQPAEIDPDVANVYFSQDELKRADNIIEYLSSPELVYSFMVSFSLMVMAAVYIVIIGIIIILFFGKYF